MFQIGLERFFVIKQVKKTVPWTYVSSDLKGEAIVETFYEQELQKNKNNKKSHIKNRFELKNYILNGEATILL